MKTLKFLTESGTSRFSFGLWFTFVLLNFLDKLNCIFSFSFIFSSRWSYLCIINYLPISFYNNQQSYNQILIFFIFVVRLYAYFMKGLSQKCLRSFKCLNRRHSILLYVSNPATLNNQYFAKASDT